MSNLNGPAVSSRSKSESSSLPHPDEVFVPGAENGSGTSKSKLVAIAVADEVFVEVLVVEEVLIDEDDSLVLSDLSA